MCAVPVKSAFIRPMPNTSSASAKKSVNKIIKIRQTAIKNDDQKTFSMHI